LVSSLTNGEEEKRNASVESSMSSVYSGNVRNSMPKAIDVWDW
jgi:hypothetical protein